MFVYKKKRKISFPNKITGKKLIIFLFHELLILSQASEFTFVHKITQFECLQIFFLFPIEKKESNARVYSRENKQNTFKRSAFFSFLVCSREYVKKCTKKQKYLICLGLCRFCSFRICSNYYEFFKLFIYLIMVCLEKLGYF